jgi:hypothetical protein
LPGGPVVVSSPRRAALIASMVSGFGTSGSNGNAFSLAHRRQHRGGFLLDLFIGTRAHHRIGAMTFLLGLGREIQGCGASMPVTINPPQSCDLFDDRFAGPSVAGGNDRWLKPQEPSTGLQLTPVVSLQDSLQMQARARTAARHGCIPGRPMRPAPLRLDPGPERGMLPVTAARSDG